MNQIKKAVFTPLVYFRESCHGESPVMTIAQIRRYLWGRAVLSEAEIRLVLNDSRVASSASGYWLKSAKPRVQDLDRLKKLKASLPYAARLASWIPFVSTVGVMNSVATGFTHPESDVDLFVIAKPGRMWTARGLFLMWIKIGRWLRGASDDQKTGRLSPDFFITEDKMDLSRVGIPHDHLLAYWVADFFPIYGMDKFNDFWLANDWLDRVLPGAYKNIRSAHIPDRYGLRAWVIRFLERVSSGRLGDLIERWWKGYEIGRIEAKVITRRQPNALVLVSDSIIKVHFDDDKRVGIRRAIAELEREVGTTIDKVPTNAL
jgi:hypothetical protein